MSIEVQHSNATAIEHLMIKNGFKVIQRVGNVDIIFATNDLWHIYVFTKTNSPNPRLVGRWLFG